MFVISIVRLNRYVGLNKIHYCTLQWINTSMVTRTQIRSMLFIVKFERKSISSILTVVDWSSVILQVVNNYDMDTFITTVVTWRSSVHLPCFFVCMFTADHVCEDWKPLYLDVDHARQWNDGKVQRMTCNAFYMTTTTGTRRCVLHNKYRYTVIRTLEV